MLPHVLDVEPSHICLRECIANTKVLTIHVLKLPKQPEPTNREAFNSIIGRSTSRPTPLRARYVSVLTPMRPNRPHIPSTIQFSKSKYTKHQTDPTSDPSAAAYPDILTTTLAVARSLNNNPRSVSVAQPVVSAPVKRCLGPERKTRKRKKHRL